MTLLRTILFFILCALACVAQVPPQTAACPVVRVVDGDTVHIQCPHQRERTVRLLGVNAPESKRTNMIGGGVRPVEPWGKVSAAWLTHLLLGEQVRVRYGKQRKDVYGRYLAYLWRARGSLFINHALVATGNARVLAGKGFTHTAYEPPLLAAQAQAKAQHAGLWSLPVNQ